jgi:hypothetical protein
VQQRSGEDDNQDGYHLQNRIADDGARSGFRGKNNDFNNRAGNNYYETDRPDFRQPDFEPLAMALPPSLFKHLMQRDDLTCYSEASVLSLIEKYILSKP